jgi:predicted RNase H-like nuclease
MHVVLGIDAAWTVTQPSGVAVAAQDGAGWALVAAASSYGAFDAAAAGRATPLRPAGTAPDAAALLAAARSLCGAPVSLAALDLPLAHTPITGRRACDDAVSRAFARRKCSTYPPSATRPGPVSDTLRAGFAGAGYALCTTGLILPGIMEVYPHPALLVLCGAAERLPYKAAKTRIYWPALDRTERRAQLLLQWAAIVQRLEQDIGGIARTLPPPPPDARGAALKAYEDALDAVICAWVAIRALQGRARPYGDDRAAIWIPH